MSFTQDELQAFNSILEQRLSAQRRDLERTLERTLEQRLSTFRREIEQRLTTVEQDILRNLPPRLLDQQRVLKDSLSANFETQHTLSSETLRHEMGERQEQQLQQFSSLVESALAAQLLAVEQLIQQRVPSEPVEPPTAYVMGSDDGFEGIEVQTEMSWDELAEVVARALDERMSSLYESILANIKHTEHYLTTQLHDLHEDLRHAGKPMPYGNSSNVQEIFKGIEQLERITESIQVAMAANHALLSNRLFHHQHLPLERAHASNHQAAPPENTAVSEHLPLSINSGEET